MTRTELEAKMDEARRASIFLSPAPEKRRVELEVLGGLSAERRIWRFLDFPKLLDVLLNRRLYLPAVRLHASSDPWECSVPQSFAEVDRNEVIDRILKLNSYLPHHVINRLDIVAHTANIAGLAGRWAERQEALGEAIGRLEMRDLEQILQLLRTEYAKRRVACCCWYMDNEESDAMWRIYCGVLGGAIRTTIGKLAKSIQFIWRSPTEDLRGKLCFAKVHYDNRITADHQCWLSKRKAFAHEREARLYFEGLNDDEGGASVEVDVRELVDSIVLSPTIEASWKSDVLARTLLEVGKGALSRCQIMISDHLIPPEDQWRNLIPKMIDMSCLEGALTRWQTGRKDGV